MSDMWFFFLTIYYFIFISECNTQVLILTSDFLTWFFSFSCDFFFTIIYLFTRFHFLTHKTFFFHMIPLFSHHVGELFATYDHVIHLLIWIIHFRNMDSVIIIIIKSSSLAHSGQEFSKNPDVPLQQAALLLECPYPVPADRYTWEEFCLLISSHATVPTATVHLCVSSNAQ